MKDFECVEIPSFFSQLTVILHNFKEDSLKYKPDESVVKAAFSRVLVYKSLKDQSINHLIITYIPDKEYLMNHDFDASNNYIGSFDKDFKGYLDYRDKDGNLLYVLRIVNGKTDGKHFIKFYDSKSPIITQSIEKSNGVYEQCEDYYSQGSFQAQDGFWYYGDISYDGTDCFYSYIPDTYTYDGPGGYIGQPTPAYSVGYGTVIETFPPYGTGDENPCDHLYRLNSDYGLSVYYHNLQSSLNEQREKGYLTYRAYGNNRTYTELAGPLNGASIPASQYLHMNGQKYEDFVHDHYISTNTSQPLYSIFSGGDLNFVYDLFINHQMYNQTSFSTTLIAPSGTVYSFQITDPTAFAAFGVEWLTDAKQSVFELFYNYSANVMSSNSEAVNELNFLKMVDLKNVGITLSKASATNVQALTRITLNANKTAVISKPCTN